MRAASSSQSFERVAWFRAWCVRAGGALGAVVLVLGSVSGCGGAETGVPTSSPTTDGGIAARVVELTAPTGTVDATLTAVARGLEARLQRFGVAGTVGHTGTTFTVTAPLDDAAVEAIARASATHLAVVESETVGPCEGAGAPSVRPDHRCYRLGTELSSVAPITGVEIVPLATDGFGVMIDIADEWETWRAALAPGVGRTVAIVADDEVLTAATLAAPALRTRLAGQLSDADARRLAAALRVADPLPVPLTTTTVTPPIVGPSRYDVWMAGLAVRACGRDLASAPMFSESGVHSHGDGLIYVHDLGRDDLRPTLGDFLAAGGFELSSERARLWDGTDVDLVAGCGGSEPTVLRWSLDGVEQSGAPTEHAIGPAELLVVVVGPASEPLPAPVAPAAMPTTRWAATPI